MRLENIARKISFAREAKTRYLIPLENFLHKVNSAGALVDFVEERKSNKQIKQDARKYFVIACINAMETYFKRITEIFVESNWVDEGLFDLLKQEKISLADLREINKKQFTLGEIMSVTYSFQDLGLINRFLVRCLE